MALSGLMRFLSIKIRQDLARSRHFGGADSFKAGGLLESVCPHGVQSETVHARNRDGDFPLNRYPCSAGLNPSNPIQGIPHEENCAGT